MEKFDIPEGRPDLLDCSRAFKVSSNLAKLFAEADKRISENEAQKGWEEFCKRAEEFRKKQKEAEARKEKNEKLEKAILALVSSTLKGAQTSTGEIESVDSILGKLANSKSLAFDEDGTLSPSKFSDSVFKSGYKIDDEGLTIRLNYSSEIIWGTSTYVVQGECFFGDAYISDNEVAFEELKAMLKVFNIDIDREFDYEDGFTKDIVTIKLGRQKQLGPIMPQ